MWYPSVNIYQQNTPGSWTDVIQSIQKTIKMKVLDVK